MRSAHCICEDWGVVYRQDYGLWLHQPRFESLPPSLLFMG